jgi:hypothetical protein
LCINIKADIPRVIGVFVLILLTITAFEKILMTSKTRILRDNVATLQNSMEKRKNSKEQEKVRVISTTDLLGMFE